MSTFAELNRRNVFRVALFYIVAAWLVLQLCDLVFQQLGVPGWAFRFVFALLVICFPLALVFSWVFELTATGIKREKDIELQASITSRTGRKIERITLVLLVCSVLTTFIDSPDPEPTSTTMTDIVTEPEQPAFVTSRSVAERLPTSIDLQGHRGARGLLPENSIPAFLQALDIGVTTLELDVAINAEGSVVVSHEPWMSAQICSHSDGREISPDEEKNLRIYAMSDAQVAAFDCGNRGHPDYPQQQALAVSKPLLKDVLLAVDSHPVPDHSSAGIRPVRFNIEIKSRPEGDNIFHPQVMEFASIVYDLIKQHKLVERTTIQSFDVRALEAIHKIDPQISIALLVENTDGLQQNLARLTFRPQIYSPDYKLLHQSQIDAAHVQNISVIPWTVNDEATMRVLLSMGVDGLITDYPDIGFRVLTEIQQGQ